MPSPYNKDKPGISLRKLIIASLVFLSILMVIFTCFGVANLAGALGPSPMIVYMQQFSDRILFFHSVAFVVICSVLISLLIVMIRRLDSHQRFNEGMYHLFSSVFSSLNVGLIVLDSEKKLRFVNPVARRLLLLDGLVNPEGQKSPQGEASLEGLDYSRILSPVLVPVAEKLSSSLANGESFSREFRVFLPEGIRCLQLDFFSFAENELGQVHVISLEDKTPEDDIRQKLSQQLEETHRYAVSKDNFFANMSHEIRTPINAILGMTYLARTVTEEPRCVEYIRKIENASEILLGVVNDILDFSKMQEHKFSLKPENFNLSDLRKIMTDLFSLKAQQKGLDFHINFDCGDSFFVFGDQFRLTQVFMNLVSNAIKFTDAGSVAVTLNHEIVGKDVILRCSVRDTGCGLSEDDLSKLFTDFEQFGEVLVKSHEGTGLGLAICKRLVELMHGVIWVDSTLNKGSSFHFVVVLKKPEQVIQPDGQLPQLQLHLAGRTGRVLIVEDNEINSEIAETLLKESGFVTERVVDGLEAVDLCRSLPADHFDLILMDIHMPRMNGYDAARILKRELLLPCPILAVTATSERTDMLEANRDLIAGWLLKPYSPGVFRNLFGRMCVPLQ